LLLGRRGPVQAKFTTPEVRELGELAGTRVITLPDEVELDPLSRELLERDGDRAARRKVSMLQAWASGGAPDLPRNLRLRFLVSPTEILGDDAGAVRGLRLIRNVLIPGDGGSVRAVAGEEGEEIGCGIVFRSVGYRGTALAGLPFDERKGILPNERGRVIDPATSKHLPGLYTSGWIKRGPSGIIGTNKPDAVETVQSMLEDRLASERSSSRVAGNGSVEAILRGRGVRFVTYPEWLQLDALEIERGRSSGRPRVKIARREEMLAALDGDPVG
jgi:ferredoxin--NADP+ reductase